ncbi:hypothetical protein HanRHA438_Chr02g0056161 [Helianthus annuus]|nr:hypothetical protein HanHA300_Chr02g0044941 [Helianthus annuus]KAJ0618028.1 hypothetical protein HanHA89_Chr02g0048531 [Helianthus annuus]KAJ0776501.1 hypothetical protein HanLR1_Chr02g0046371 [Helianthus annuus]KAJ0939003.1 hypothetical protein HanRHA438_Chr02g0056161 [Helianthus annuus]
MKFFPNWKQYVLTQDTGYILSILSKKQAIVVWKLFDFFEPLCFRSRRRQQQSMNVKHWMIADKARGLFSEPKEAEMVLVSVSMGWVLVVWR